MYVGYRPNRIFAIILRLQFKNIKHFVRLYTRMFHTCEYKPKKSTLIQYTYYYYYYYYYY